MFPEFLTRFQPVEHAASHVLAVARIALNHGVRWLEASVGNLGNAQGLMVSLFSGDDRSVGDQGEMDPRVGHQVGLELSQFRVESSIKLQGGRDGRHNLAD